MTPKTSKLSERIGGVDFVVRVRERGEWNETKRSTVNSKVSPSKYRLRRG